MKTIVSLRTIASTKQGSGFLGHLIKSFIPIKKSRICIDGKDLVCSLSKRKCISKTEVIDIIMSKKDNRNTARWLSLIINSNINALETLISELKIDKDIAIYSRSSKEILSHKTIISLDKFSHDCAKDIGNMYLHNLSKKVLYSTNVSTTNSNVIFKNLKS